MTDDISDLHFTPMGHGQVRAVAEARRAAETDEWARLETLARAATAGPWQAPEGHRYGAVISTEPAALEAWLRKHDQDDLEAYGGALVGESMAPADRQYIAAANPAKLIALLVLLALYRAQRDDYKRQFEFQCRNRQIGARMEHELQALIEAERESHAAFVAAVEQLELDTQPVPAARIAGYARIEKAARELLTDDDMPNHWEDCACSYCNRHRELQYALNDLADTVFGPAPDPSRETGHSRVLEDPARKGSLGRHPPRTPRRTRSARRGARMMFDDDGDSFPDGMHGEVEAARKRAVAAHGGSETRDERVMTAISLAEGALHGTEPRRAIWTDSDYLVAILAALTGNGDRARTAALAYEAALDRTAE